MERRPLSEIELTGVRRVIRRLLFGCIALGAMGGAIGYMLPAHKVHDSTFHSNYDDGGLFSLVVFGVVLAACLFTFRRGHWAGYVMGLVSSVGAIAAFAPVLLSHLLSRVTYDYGEAVFSISVLALFALGPITIVAEPILFLGQRHQLERDVDPQFPTARVVSK